MQGKKLVAIAVIAVSIIVAGALIAGLSMAGSGDQENTPPTGTGGQKNYVVNVTDSVDLQDR